MDIAGMKVFKYENNSKRFEEDWDHTPVLEAMMKQYTLYFSLTTSGEIFNVLAHDDEPLTTLNLKRGLLSSLQTKILSGEELQKRSTGLSDGPLEPLAVQETDVAGKRARDCPESARQCFGILVLQSLINLSMT
jgi:hypothetical protein